MKHQRMLRFLFVMLMIAPSALADGDKRRETTLGTLTVRPGNGYECLSKLSYGGPCEVAELAGEIVAANTYVNIVDSFPSHGKAKIVFVQHTAGGSGSGEITNLVDASGSRPIILQLNGYYPAPSGSPATIYRLSGTAGGVTWAENAWDETGDLGEPIQKFYRYKFGGAIKFLRSIPIFNFSPVNGKKYASGLLDDPPARKPLLSILRSSQFKEFHKYFGTSSYLEFPSSRYIVGTGCVPHACGVDSGIFIIDTDTRSAVALTYDRPFTSPDRGQLYGAVPAPATVPATILNGWMIKNGFSWRSVVKDLEFGADAHNGASTARPSEAPYSESGGTLTVPVTINGVISLDFTVDSGAADVSLPADVALTLMRSDTLKLEDFTGQQVYKLADGSLIPSKTFVIHNMKIGERSVSNVTASLTGVDGSLLLGQSFLSRFKRVSFDYGRHVLILE